MGNHNSSPAISRSVKRDLARGTLSHNKTNGKCLLGTLGAATLPYFLENNPLPNGHPWSNLHPGTNYYEVQPNTGVIRHYDFTISRSTLAPDGYEIPVLLINGAFPGPTIEANWGDWIEVTVNNNITGPEEGTSLHWHGFLQTGRPWEDGVPSVSQCPIVPGQSFTYRFRAELYGTSWYHSHYSAQYASGLNGPIVIYGPRETLDYDIDIGPVLLSDWYHEGYDELVELTMTPNGGPFNSTNNLINGKGNFDCATTKAGDRTPCHDNAGISKFRFERGKTHRLRLINSGAEGSQRFSIDGHMLTVIANDFVQVEEYETEVVTLGIGQRTDVLVKACGELDAYWMRSNISKCAFAAQPYALAAIYYDDADENKDPESIPWDVPEPAICGNDPLELTKPLMPLAVEEPDLTLELLIDPYVNATGNFLWKFGNVTFRGNYNSPTLLLSNLGNFSFEDQWNVQNVGESQVVRIIVSNNSTGIHPLHLHGFNFFVLDEGPGLEWSGTIVRPDNPQRRDTQQIRPQSYLVLQFNAGDNPGMWPFHCHIAWHVSAGFFTQILAGPSEVEQLSIPNIVAETCRQWAAWTNTNIPDQIDSGL